MPADPLRDSFVGRDEKHVESLPTQPASAFPHDQIPLLEASPCPLCGPKRSNVASNARGDFGAAASERISSVQNRSKEGNQSPQ